MKSIYRLFILGLFAVSATACFESKTENAAEDVGESIEATAEEAGDAAEEAVEDVSDEME